MQTGTRFRLILFLATIFVTAASGSAVQAQQDVSRCGSFVERSLGVGPFMVLEKKKLTRENAPTHDEAREQESHETYLFAAFDAEAQEEQE